MRLSQLTLTDRKNSENLVDKGGYNEKRASEDALFIN